MQYPQFERRQVQNRDPLWTASWISFRQNPTRVVGFGLERFRYADTDDLEPVAILENFIRHIELVSNYSSEAFLLDSKWLIVAM